MVWAIVSTTVGGWFATCDAAPVSAVVAVVVDGSDRWPLYLEPLYPSLVRGVVMSLLGSGGSPGLSGASVDGENGGGERLPRRRYLWVRGRAAAERTLRMLFAREWLRFEPRLGHAPEAPLGLVRPSLGALALTGGYLELARVGIGNGGSFGSVRLGLLAL
jgi:hypothetical protein